MNFYCYQNKELEKTELTISKLIQFDEKNKTKISEVKHFAD